MMRRAIPFLSITVLAFAAASVACSGSGGADEAAKVTMSTADAEAVATYVDRSDAYLSGVLTSLYLEDGVQRAPVLYETWDCRQALSDITRLRNETADQAPSVIIDLELEYVSAAERLAAECVAEEVTPEAVDRYVSALSEAEGTICAALEVLNRSCERGNQRSELVLAFDDLKVDE